MTTAMISRSSAATEKTKRRTTAGKRLSVGRRSSGRWSRSLLGAVQLALPFRTMVRVDPILATLRHRASSGFSFCLDFGFPNRSMSKDLIGRVI